ncbi:MAG TPA: hypothetical protein VGU27_06820, partial [Candidatus Eisenbacteria bacterium]|nr:hypothetical protein [Candidatus Eisenbacteria bacterium]
AARRRPATGAAVVALALAMPFARLALPAPPAGLPARGVFAGIWDLWPRQWSPFRHDRRYDAFGRAAMARLPAHAVVLAGWDPAETLRYFVYAEPLRRDVDVLYAAPRGARFDRLAATAAAAGRPVFAAAVRDSLGAAGETAEDLPAVPGWALWRVRLPKP